MKEANEGAASIPVPARASPAASAHPCKRGDLARGTIGGINGCISGGGGWFSRPRAGKIAALFGWPGAPRAPPGLAASQKYTYGRSVS